MSKFRVVGLIFILLAGCLFWMSGFTSVSEFIHAQEQNTGSIPRGTNPISNPLGKPQANPEKPFFPSGSWEASPETGREPVRTTENRPANQRIHRIPPQHNQPVKFPPVSPPISPLRNVGSQPVQQAGYENTGVTSRNQTDGTSQPGSLPPKTVGDEKAPTEAKPKETSALSLTPEALALRKKVLEETKELDEKIREELLKQFAQAEQWLKQAQEAAKRELEYQGEISNAPKLLTELKAALKSPLAEWVIAVSEDDTLAALEQKLAAVEAEYQAAKTLLDTEEAQLKARSERKIALPKLIEEARKKLETTNTALQAPGAEGESALAASARKSELETRQQLLKKQLNLYLTEQQRDQAVAELGPLKRDTAKRQFAYLEKGLEQWKKIVEDFRREETKRQVNEARIKLANAHPSLKVIAARNVEFTEKRTTFTELISKTVSEVESADNLVKTLETEYQSVSDREAKTGLTTTLGFLLRSQRSHLPNLESYRERLKEIENRVPNAQLELMVLEEERANMGDIEEGVKTILEKLPDSARQHELFNVEQMAREMLEKQKEYLDGLVSDYQKYLQELGKLDVSIRKLVSQTETFENHIDERVLWIRSTGSLSMVDASHAWQGFTSIMNLEKASVLFDAFCASALKNWTILLLVLIPCLGLAFLGWRFRKQLRNLTTSFHTDSTTGFLSTLRALFIVALISLVRPLLIWLVGWFLCQVSPPPLFPSLVGNALQQIAWLYGTMEMFRQICRPGGVAEVFFGWSATDLKVLYRYASALMVVGVPLVTLILISQRYQDGDYAGSLGRFSFLAGMLVLATFFWKVFSPSKGAIQDVLNRSPKGWLSRLRYLWFPVIVGAPIGLGVLSAVGYHFTAEQLATRMQVTLWMFLGLVVGQALLVRWVMSVKGHWDSPETAAEEDAITRLQKAEELKRQGTQLLQGLAAVIFLVGSWMTWSNVLPALQIFHRVELWTTTVTEVQTVDTPDGPVTSDVTRPKPITLAHLLSSLLIMGVMVFASQHLPGILDVAFLSRLPLDPGGRHAIVTIFRYALTLVGIIFSLKALGIGWGSVQWLAAAMTVGLGFGLQEIFANFVSGLIILFERPIRVGDLVTVGDLTGHVARIQIRATTITDFDRRELIVPNKKFITGDVVNWTLSDPISRIVIPVGVAYGSDTSLTQKLLLETASAHPLVMNDPGPTAIMTGFGDSTLDFELRLFIPRRDVFSRVLHDLNTTIDKEFTKAGIEIAFPQQEITIRNLPEPVRLSPQQYGNELGEGDSKVA